MTVIDASALVEVLLMTGAGSPVAERLLASGEAFHAPHLLPVEVTQAMRGLAARGEVSDQRAEEALEDLRDFPIDLYEHDLLLPRAWQLRGHITIYDGVYVALAELLAAPLLTRDARLARVEGLDVRVDLF